MFSESEIAVPILLSVWQDPQGNVVLHDSLEECNVFFGCWTEAAEPADYLCKLTFDRAWAVRGLCLEGLPYRVKQHEHSCIYEIENSGWLEQVSEQRLGRHPDWKSWDETRYRHFVVLGHDNYYDIIAAEFKEQRIIEEAGELVRLIREA